VVVGQGVDGGKVAGNDGLDGVADGLGDLLQNWNAVDLSDDVAALSNGGLVKNDWAVDAVLGSNLLAGLSECNGVVDGSSLEGCEGCVIVSCSIGFTLHQDCSSDGSNGLRALDGDNILALLLVTDFLVDDLQGLADAFVTGCAGLGLEGLELSSAGVDGALNRGGNGDNSCWSNCFDNGHNCFGNGHDWFSNWDDWFFNCNCNRCLRDDQYILRGCPGGCQEANNKELEKHAGKLVCFCLL